ncbi:MAG: ABC transporter permease, partial [Candidatus Geothermarchaeales archaeon]
MREIVDGIIRAIELILSLDPEVLSITLLSLRVSGTAVALSSLVALPLGAVLGLHEFRGKSVVANVVNTMMGLPPVVVGLFVFLLLSRAGPLGPLDLLYSPTAMIIAQLILAGPIVTGVTMAAVGS